MGPWPPWVWTIGKTTPIVSTVTPRRSCVTWKVEKRDVLLAEADADDPAPKYPLVMAHEADASAIQNDTWPTYRLLPSSKIFTSK